VVLVSRPKSYMKDLPKVNCMRTRESRGRLVPGLEMRVSSRTVRKVPRDGKSMGELRLRGPWITEEYYREPGAYEGDGRDGWLCTGDVGDRGP